MLSRLSAMQQPYATTMRRCRWIVLLSWVLLSSCASFPEPDGGNGDHAPVVGVRVVSIHHHDRDDFTQGLEYRDGYLYESTGLRGQSAIKKIAFGSGKVVIQRHLPGHLFGEGLALYGHRVYQLTWKAGVCLVYDAENLEPFDVLQYSGEGWGLARYGDTLVMSNGSNTLVFRDPETFTVVGEVRVRDGKRAIVGLNELEVVGNAIYANIFGRDLIAEIDGATGRVQRWLDVSAVARRERAAGRGKSGVLNGIARMPESGQLLVTGKNWAAYYRVSIQP
jgi:glutaminyl-peptide cyclotransferase